MKYCIEEDTVNRFNAVCWSAETNSLPPPLVSNKPAPNSEEKMRITIEDMEAGHVLMVAVLQAPEYDEDDPDPGEEDITDAEEAITNLFGKVVNL